QGRGLKPPPGEGHLGPLAQVAPRAGAWIETTWSPGRSSWRSVAPRAGAWIETRKELRGITCRSTSPLAQGRGLKRCVGDRQLEPRLSPLAQGRGLKRW